MSSSNNNYRKLVLIPIIFAVALVFSGCSEDSQRAQTKQASKAVQQALAEYQKTGDFEKARSVLASADTGDSELVKMVQADLDYGKAGRMQSEIAPFYKQIDASLNSISAGLNRITQLKINKEQIESQLRAHNEEIQLLNNRLKGDSNQPGLIAELEKSQAQLAKLQSQKSALTSKAQDAQKQADAIQAKADELLRRAQNAQADEKSRLTQEAYEVIRGSDSSTSKSAYLKAAQEFEDQAAVVQSEITMLAPRVNSLKSAMDNTQKRIAELEKSSTPSQAGSQIEAINASISQSSENVNASLGMLTQAKDNLEKKIEEITKLYGDAYSTFSRISDSESLTQLAKIAAADTAYKNAVVKSGFGTELRHLAARVAVMPQTGIGDGDRSQLAERYLADSGKFIEHALQDFNDASQNYTRVSSRGALGTAVLKNQLLALNQKAYVAEQIENAAAKAQALADANEVVDRALSMDQDFVNTDAAKFFYQMSGKKPPVFGTEPNSEPAAKSKKARRSANSTDSNTEAGAGEQPAGEANEPNSTSGQGGPDESAQDSNTAATADSNM